MSWDTQRDVSTVVYELGHTHRETSARWSMSWDTQRETSARWSMSWDRETSARWSMSWDTDRDAV